MTRQAVLQTAILEILRECGRVRGNFIVAHARAPIPALGGIGRFYVVPNISITGELTAFKIPDSVNNQYNAHYIDVDVYGTLNFTNNVGVQAGYRVLNVGYLIKTDTGSFVLKGPYIGAVLRY